MSYFEVKCLKDTVNCTFILDQRGFFLFLCTGIKFFLNKEKGQNISFLLNDCWNFDFLREIKSQMVIFRYNQFKDILVMSPFVANTTDYKHIYLWYMLFGLLWNILGTLTT